MILSPVIVTPANAGVPLLARMTAHNRDSRVRGNDEKTGPERILRVKPNGFTLIELMVTLFIIGLVAGAVVLSLPGDSAALSEDADRFAARVAAARDEAVVGARPIAVWIAPSGYGFDARQDRQWVPLNARTLANRDWKPGTLARIEGGVEEAASATDAAQAATSRARFWFDSTGLPNMPVTVVLSRGANSDSIVISATGEVGRPR